MPLWSDRRVLLCVGTGGVGKTTVSAAIALAAASRGLRTLVMTIDPARRLANALGLSEFGNMEHEVSAEVLAKLGVELQGPLWAMMPDVKRTFDDLIARAAPDAERRDKILRNRFYQRFSTVLAGSLEYAAVEKLYEVYASDRYDLIVLDTPPSQNATDFLQAPGRILDFLEQDTLQWILKPYGAAGRFSFKLLDVGSSFVFRSLGKLAGAETIGQIVEMVLGFQGMYDGFRHRSTQVRQLLMSDEVAFVVVTSPQPAQRGSVRQLREGLHHEGMRVRAAVVNRVRQPPFGEVSAEIAMEELRRAVADWPPEEASGVLEALGEEVELWSRGQNSLGTLREVLGDTPVVELPELPLDAHDLQSLVALYGAFLESDH